MKDAAGSVYNWLRERVLIVIYGLKDGMPFAFSSPPRKA